MSILNIITIILLVIILGFLIKSKFHIFRSYDGQMVITSNEEEGTKIFSLELDKDPSEMEKMKSVSFRVTHEETPGYDEIAD